MPTKEDCIAIVGLRAITPYGRSVTKQLTADLSVAGLTIVSGMARGIDTAAHMEAGGRTIAVLGCGVDRVYPAENKQLMQDIIQKGTVISEFPLGPSRKVAISLSGTESLADSVTGQLSSKQGTGGGNPDRIQCA